MMERRHIARAVRNGEAHVLVTLVNAEGSSNRKPGARLLTSNAIDQAYAGSVTGGSLEAEIVKRAASKVHGGAIVDRYSVWDGEESAIQFGAGRGGIVDLLHEPTNTPEFNALMYAFNLSFSGESFTVVTWLPGGSTQFARALLAEDGGIEFATPGTDPLAIANALRNGSHWQAARGGVYVERITPPQRLVVLGASEEAKPLVRMASLLGWNVIVADARPQLAHPERFPEAQRVSATAPSHVESLGISNLDAVVLMTNTYDQDRDWLAVTLPLAPRYFGLLGAKQRNSLLVSEAAAMTGLPLSICCERIHASIGLDVGGGSPEGLALAVISEANDRCGANPQKPFRLTADDVAAQIQSGTASPYSQNNRALLAGHLV